MQDATWYRGIRLGPGHIVLDGDPAAPFPRKGHSSNNFRGLRAQVSLRPYKPFFCETVTSNSSLYATGRVCPVCNVGVLWTNGWMDQDATSRDFWATVCKTVRPMLSDRRPVLSVCLLRPLSVCLLR